MNESDPSAQHSSNLESVAEASDLEDHETAQPGAAEPPPPEAPLPDTEADEDGGGPVKTFLEHLEDLRWVLIKSGASVLISMVVCLVAAPYLVGVLEAPLRRADQLRETKEQIVVLKLGTNILWRLPRQALNWPSSSESNRVESYQMVPVQDGTNILFALQLDPTPAQDLGPSSQTAIKNYEPLGPFTVALQIALYGGFGLALPFVLLFIGEFVVPALKRKEKKFLYRGLVIGSVLFILGVVFCYFVLVEIALSAAVNFSKWMHFSADEWRAQEYLGFVLKFMLGMGLAFELPVVLLTLVKIGLLDYRKLSKFRPYWVVVNLILSSLLTPPDPLSMVMMALPLQLLYEVSVFIARIWGKREESESGPSV